jgi:hypothetical protein
MLTQTELKNLLRYDPDTGEFWWIKSRIAARQHLPAGRSGPKGYRSISINRQPILLHRLAFLYMTGEWPTLFVDHINGVRDDNRWCNLREATKRENQQNLKKRTDNTTGYTGVTRVWKSTTRWRASLGGVMLGHFTSPEDAYAAYLIAKQMVHHFQPIPREICTVK